MLKFEGVTKQYLYGARVLGATDLTVADGEIIAVLGSELSGKTTFLKVAAGVTDSEGKVELDGKTVEGRNDDIIMIFDDLALFENRTSYYNLAYPLKIRGMDKSQIDEIVKSAAEKMGITACLDLRVRKLPLIDRKRLAFARIYLRPVKLILVDALTKGLNKADADILWSECAPLLLENAKQGASVIFSTRERDEALSIADRIIVMSYNEIKQVGEADKIKACPENIWAAEAVHKHYNFEKARLESTDSGLELVFWQDSNGYDNPREQEKEYRLCADCFLDRVPDSYIGKEIFVGWTADCFAADGERTEPVKYALRVDDDYILYTQSGKKVRASQKADSVCTLPRVECAKLFDSTNENSILLK